MKTVHLIRHGETEQNVLKVWQGHTGTSLNKTGLQQANLLASRLKDSNAPVYSSDLKRASETASFLSKKIELRETLREINVGDFTGKSVGQTFSSNNEIFESLQDDSYQFPNGETVKEFKQRVKNELDFIFANIENGSEAIVVTHGFFIGTAIGLTIGFSNYPFPIGNIENTSISTLIKRESIIQVNKFNDSLHLSELNIDFPRETTENKITFIRHGQTDSNKSGIWQGHIDNPLNEIGKNTAQKLRNTFDQYDVYLSSTYQRAMETLSLVVDDEDILTSENLIEMNLGNWEGLTTLEIIEQYHDDFINALFLDYKCKYGINGESTYEAGVRVENLLKEYTEKNLLMASHGGTIKAGVTNLLKAPENKAASSFTIPNNLGVCCLVLKENKYFLWSYNVGKIGYENISYNQ
ncbi:histidine phosphatase family protein [Candidatus Actinomarina]|nr:histidine phosphatase family protein [Candidatus Actinomarina sp.]